MANFPDPQGSAEAFVAGPMSSAIGLWNSYRVRTTGSRRPQGQRRTQWSVTMVLAMASLEAGLEDLLLGAHGFRMSKVGQDANPYRSWLVEAPLQAPNAQKLERLLLSHFGITLGSLPAQARFTPYRKPISNEGRGTPASGPAQWATLRPYLDTASYIRNATAHGDTSKLASHPQSLTGYLWVPLKAGGWSVQQPHALTCLRAIVGVFNTVAVALDDELGFSTGSLGLVRPDEAIPYP